MTIKKGKKLLTAALLLAAGSGAAAWAQADGFLSSLNRGLWELRAVGGGPSRAAQSRICLGDPAKLVQIQHGNADCTQRVLTRRADRVTYSYSCPGLGQGVTTIRRESGRLIHVQSQGIRNGSPFNFSVEGRQNGSC